MRALSTLSLVVVLLDQWTKRLVNERLPLYDDHEVVSGFLSLQHVRNTGAVFGLLQHTEIPGKAILFSILSAMALVALAYYARTIPTEERIARVALALVLGGAVGNLIDRLRLGYVIDFVKMYYGTYVWPNYNVADAAITTGLVLLIIDSFRRREPSSPPTPSLSA